MTDTNPYFDDVVSTHILIRKWLGEASPSATILPALLARFSPDYSMVSTTGRRLDHAGLTAFFSGAGGSRPGLQMHIDDLVLLQENAIGATVFYREIQSLPGGETTQRFSTVVYEKNTAGTLLWRHLHETWAA